MQLPPNLHLASFRCHKIVQAARITTIEVRTDNTAFLHLEGHEGLPVLADRDYMSKHNPQEGGFFVVYEDGYASWSPAKAFEEGYTLLTEEAGGEG